MEANIRAGEINSENAKTKSKNTRFRPYKCPYCNKYHLTSMTKHFHKMVTDPEYRTKVNESRFIKEEADYWNDKFNIK
jgi:hypothetical protein